MRVRRYFDRKDCHEAAALVVVVALGAGLLGAAAPAADRRIPGADAVRACAVRSYWPTMTLAVRATTAWVACKEEARLVRIDLARGKTLARVRLPGAPIAVALGFGSLWALDSSTLYRLDAATGRIAQRVSLGANAPYNIWVGGGSVWVADSRARACCASHRRRTAWSPGSRSVTGRPTWRSRPPTRGSSTIATGRSSGSI